MVEGLWIVQFHGPQGNGRGVVVLARDQVLGGDSGFAYSGKYEFQGNAFKARVKVENFDPAVPNVLGIPGSLDLVIDGQMRGDTIDGTAALAIAPDSKMIVRLKKYADLN
jgi:hypothetical protein